MAQVMMRYPPIQVGIRQAGVEADGLVEVGNRLGVALFLEKRESSIGVSPGILAVEANGLRVIADRGVELSLLAGPRRGR